MSEEYTTKPSAVFWFLAILFLLWNVFGCGMYLTEMFMSDAAYAEAFGEDLAAVRDVYPVWGIAGYAAAVWSGLFAAILFILRKRQATSVFLFSLVMAAIGFIPTFANSVLRDAAGSYFWVMPVFVMAFGIIEVVTAQKQTANGILR